MQCCCYYAEGFCYLQGAKVFLHDSAPSVNHPGGCSQQPLRCCPHGLAKYRLILK